MEQIHFTGISKEDKYKNLLPQLHALLLDEKDRIANYANVCAALQSIFNFHWIFKMKDKENNVNIFFVNFVNFF